MSGSLSKFGVPLGSFGQGRGGILQPKFTNRYRVRVSHFGPIAGGLELTQQVQSIAKPSVKHDEVEVHSYNSRAYFLGKHSWEPVELVVRDDITNSVTQLITHQIQKQLNHFEQTAFAAGVNYKFIMYVETLDGGNDVMLDGWMLEGCMLTNVKFAPLDYTKADSQVISMTVRYDNAIMGGGLMTHFPQRMFGSNVD